MKTTFALLSGVSAKVYFQETFDDLSKWTASTWKSDSEMGKFELKVPKWSVDEKDDLSLATTQDARFYGSSATFDKFSNEDKTLIVQYQVKYDQDVECGGGYLKIGEKMGDATKFGDPTEYNIMFGPDKCGYTKRTHLIFQYKGKNVLKTADLPYKQGEEGLSTLYRLVVTPDNTVKVLIDKEEVYSGSLETDWKLLEDKEITDSDDKKPSDWVDEEQIDDPEDKKPADWVEEAENVDTDAKKPDDWDSEEDGDWEAPMKANPDYKGEWKPKKIANPAYKGPWEARKIPNPKYEANDKLYKYDFGFVGLDLWQVKSGTFFDNLIITDDEAEADKLAEKWTKLSAKEKIERDSTTTTTTTTTEKAETEAEPDDDKDDDEDL